MALNKEDCTKNETATAVSFKRLLECILTAYLDSGLSPDDYLRTIAVSKKGYRALWEIIGKKWHEENNVYGYEVLPYKIVPNLFGRDLRNLLATVNKSMSLLEIQISYDSLVVNFEKYIGVLESIKPIKIKTDKRYLHEENIVLIGYDKEIFNRLIKKNIYTKVEEYVELHEGHVGDKGRLCTCTEPSKLLKVIILNKDTEYLRYEIKDVDNICLIIPNGKEGIVDKQEVYELVIFAERE